MEANPALRVDNVLNTNANERLACEPKGFIAVAITVLPSSA